MMNLKPCKYKKILFIISILMISSLNILLMNLETNQISKFKDKNDSNKFQIENLKSQDLDSDNVYSGIGAPWNVTHWANRTDYNLPVSFMNDSYDVAEIPLGSGWKGYKLDVNVNELSDIRNWCNGSFNYGIDNNYQTPGNDTTYISNKFQNWTFGKYDYWDDSDMSGNYMDSTDPDTDGHDCLELRITGDHNPPNSHVYDGQDRCYWTSFIEIPRGRVIESELIFDVRDFHLMPSNDFELRISINDQMVYSLGALNLREVCQDSWRTFSIPQGFWWNSSQIYSNPINNSLIKLNITFIYNQDGSWEYTGVENQDFQQLFIDNIQLITKAEVKPSQIQLKMNNQEVNDIDWGKGAIEQNNLWTTSPVKANFSSSDIWELGGYEIDLKTNLNLFTRKDTPETNYETNTDSLGTQFSVSNNSLTNWDFYAYFSVPTGYEENEMRINFPADFTITWVSEPQDPSTNRLSECDTSTQGLLTIPVNTISLTPDGFWKFKATSPNYCEQINILNNATSSWIIDNQFLSGDYINITAKISDPALISGYIQQTQAQLQIRFPNGTLWTSQSQLNSPDSNGYVYFYPFRIPILPPNYEVGEYEAIITWNNSYSTLGLNETGIIYKKFNVIHKSKLTSDQNYYEQIFEGEVINLKVSYNDKENFNAVQDALVYLDNFTGGRQYFSEISPGYYFLEFNTTGGIACNNTLTIYSNSTSYLNNQVNVTIEIIQQTSLTAQEYPTIQVKWNNNFSIHLNYTIKSTGIGISTTPINNWIGETSIVESNQGEYNLTCNSSAYEVNKIHSLFINFHEEGYQSQSIIIGVFLIERQSNISVYIDSLEIPEMHQVNRSFNEELSISVRVSDTARNEFFSDESLTLISEKSVINLPYSSDYWYNTSIICTPLNFSLGLNLIDIRFIKENYEISLFSFQLIINQIEICVDTVGFEDSYSAEIGETIDIQIRLFDPDTNDTLDNAIVKYSWEYGIGTLNETNPGTYQTFIELSEDLRGNHKINLIITPEDSTYQTTQYSFVVVIREPIVDEPEFPNYFLWIIIGVLISIVSALGVLSFRTYVYMPRKRKKEAKLLSKTQRFKDLNNIQAIVVIHKFSGIPIYSRSYSILEKHKKELFSGFIQAITMIGEEFVVKDVEKPESDEKESAFGVEKMIELDFKQFYCLIADIEDLRVVFILKERSSERLKSQVSHLILALNLKLSAELENWDGSLDKFEILIPEILNEYFELYYKDSFKLAGDINLIRMKKEKSLSKMEMRVVNVIQSMSNDNMIANLNSIIELVHEDNKNLIIEAIESLIKQKVIIPLNN